MTAAHDTNIEWTHVPHPNPAVGHYRGATWNPVRGCKKVSPGCKHCYAETFAERWRGIPGHAYEQGFDLRLVPEKLDEPLRATRPRAYFVNSMSDLHQDGVPESFLTRAYNTMGWCHRHLFMVLTKRDERMAAFVGAYTATANAKPYPNVWLGVSVEDRKYGLPRVDVLRTIPAAVRFLSVEPLLEDLGDLDLTGIHWVIVGGESGPGARPFDLAWTRRILAQCREQRVPAFVKQVGARPHGEWEDIGPGLQHLYREQEHDREYAPPGGDGVKVRRRFRLALESRKGGDPSEWPADIVVREWPACVAAYQRAP